MERRELRFGDRDLRVGGGSGDRETLEEGLGGKEMGREEERGRALTQVWGSPTRWEGKESGAQRPHRE